MNNKCFLFNQRDIDSYQPISKIDEGSYGIVYKAIDKETNEVVAIKKIKLQQGNESLYDFPITSIREINIVFTLCHPNILKFKQIAYGNKYNKIYTVMEYLDFELKNLLIVQKHSFSSFNIKSIIYQLLCAVSYLHHNWVIHRDIKPSNILISKEGVVKLGDFGLARKFSSPLGKYSPLVVTLWYRAPELLFWMNRYGSKIDIWSIGCILGELVLNRPLFQGESEIDQINKIFNVLGNLSENEWNSVKAKTTNANIGRIVFNKYERKIDDMFKNNDRIDNKGVDLLKKMLEMDEEKRISSEKALEHEWFKEEGDDYDKKLRIIDMEEINRTCNAK